MTNQRGVSKLRRSLARLGYANLVLALLAAACVVLVVVALCSERAEGLFGVVYILLIGALLWGIGCWLTSDALYGYNPRNRSRTDPKRGSRADVRRYKVRKYGVSSLIALACAAALAVVLGLDRGQEEALVRGWLVPARGILPVVPACTEPFAGDGLLVFHQPGWVGGSDEFPHTVVRVKGRDVLVLERRPNGPLAVSFTVYGDDGRVLAQVKRCRVTVDPGRVLQVRRVDRSTLSIRDAAQGQELTIRYFHPRAVWIDGFLRDPGSDEPIRLKGSLLTAVSCTYRSGRPEIEVE